ncbi:phage tailspike protein [Serratia sp. L9]|uniref:phage head-binding domain-containing protein n=1 Tax=Serratia sp. L9 TaxID=3423946 RepID=UPI003D671CDB
MIDVNANVIVSMPSQLFTLAHSFEAAANGKIYIGKIDTDPAIPANQIQVYLQNNDGSTVPVAQPITINTGGYPVYNGQVAKFVTVEGHSMAVYDSSNVQQFYFPNRLEYATSPSRQELVGSGGYLLTPSAIYQSWKAVGDVRGWGVVGDGTDEASKLQELFAESSKMLIPKGMQVTHSTVNVPAGANIELSAGSKLIWKTKNALNFLIGDSYTIFDTPEEGATTINIATSTIASGDMVMIKRVGDTTDAWYTANAQNPLELGWQSAIRRVQSSTGTSIVVSGGIPWSMPDGGTVIKLVIERTTVTGGEIVSAMPTADYMIERSVNSIDFIGVKFNFSSKKGIRINTGYSANFQRCSFINRVGNGSLFFGYGTSSCTISECEFLGGTAGDAQLVTYAGCNKISSERNKFLIEYDSNSNSAGLYFGAKCIECTSTDDSIYGGKFGIYAAFGVQRGSIIRPKIDGSTVSGIFAQECQFFDIDSTSITIRYAVNEQVRACIAVKDCDDFHIKGGGEGILDARVGRAVSVFNSPTYEGTTRKGIRITSLNVRSGHIYIEAPTISGEISSNVLYRGSIRNYFATGNSYRTIFEKNRCLAGNIVSHRGVFNQIVNNETYPDASSGGVSITGASRYTEVKGNIVHIISGGVAFSVASAATTRYTTAIYPDNLMLGIGTFVDNGVADDHTPPTVGIVTPSLPANWWLPVSSGDPLTRRLYAGYRAKGDGATDQNAWFAVKSTESF